MTRWHRPRLRPAALVRSRFCQPSWSSCSAKWLSNVSSLIEPLTPNIVERRWEWDQEQLVALDFFGWEIKVHYTDCDLCNGHKVRSNIIVIVEHCLIRGTQLWLKTSWCQTAVWWSLSLLRPLERILGILWFVCVKMKRSKCWVWNNHWSFFLNRIEQIYRIG